MALERNVYFADLPKAVQSIVVFDDLARLSEEQKVTHYRNVCEALGLDPITQPLGYYVFDGKLRLYAKKDAAEQLRFNHGISCRIVRRSWIAAGEDGAKNIYLVEAEASMPIGNGNTRVDDASGSISVIVRRKNRATGKYEQYRLTDEEVALAMMRAETKAKRRATLSICGLGILDQIEVDDLPGADREPEQPKRSSRLEQASKIMSEPDGDLPATDEPVAASSNGAAGGVGYLTRAQASEIWQLAREVHGDGVDEFMRKLLEKYKVSRTVEIPAKEFDRIKESVSQDADVKQEARA